MNPLMETVGRASETWSAYVLHVTWQASAVALVVLVAVCMARRLNAHVRYALLLLALVKFMVPPFAAAPFGLFSQVPPLVTLSTASRHAGQTGPTEGTSNNTPSVDPLHQHALDGDHLHWTAIGERPIEHGRAIGHSDLQISRHTVSSPQAKVSTLWRSLGNIPIAAWLVLFHIAGSAAVASWLVLQYRRLAQLSHSATEVTSFGEVWPCVMAGGARHAPVG